MPRKHSTEPQFISPLAIDMGATRTGCLNLTYRAGEEPLQHEGFVVMVDSSDITLSQENRRAKRHQRRNYKRKHLVRRLLYLLVEKHYGIPDKELTASTRIQLQSLLTRRGFSYEAADEKLQEQAAGILSDDVSPFLPDLPLREGRSFLRELERLTGDPQFDPEALIHQDEARLAAITKEKNELKSLLNTIAQVGRDMIKARETGARHRSVYFEEIQDDFKHHKELARALKKHKVSEKRFLRLVCNLSNLPLKPLRRYFNDPTMKEQDRWEPERLHRFIYRWIRSWHAEKGSDKHRAQLSLLQALEKSTDIIDFLETTDPVQTIPPYEDQNNRRPPLCHTLKLDAESLDYNFPGWQQSLYKLIQDDPLFSSFAGPQPGTFQPDDDMQKILDAHRRSHQSYKKTGPDGKTIDVPGRNETSLTAASIILQRFLDRSKAIDPYHLREQMRNAGAMKRSEQPRGKKVQEASEALDRMKKLLGESDAHQFIRLAQRYYRETAEARRGLWSPPDPSGRRKEVADSHNGETLFFRCDAKTGSRNNNRSSFVGAILGIRFEDEQQFEEFAKAWRTTRVGRSTIRSLCKSIEDVRKRYKEAFGILYHDPRCDDKDVLKTREDTSKAAEALAELLGHSDSQRSRYNNPFSLAQLHNLIEVDRSGFSSICRACSLEEQWRSMSEDVNGQTVARATKLSADTGRPFDGQLGYLLDRIAGRIAAEKQSQLEACNLPAKCTVSLPILIEENTFSFRYQLSELKRAPKKERDKFLKPMKAMDEEPLAKTERIKKDSGNLCPYTGKKIGAAGELDHIVPRSASKEIYGTVFNAEINLIYCSSEGNRKKGERVYSLEDLNDAYLQKHFRTADREAIRSQIRSTLERLQAEGKRIVFDSLDHADRRDLRHALFDPALRGIVFEHLMNRSKSRVNGTQLFFAKRLRSHLLNRLSKRWPKIEWKARFEFFDHRKDSLGMYRQALAKDGPQFQKSENQGDPSHIIDAAMVFACALDRPETSPLLASALTPAEDESLQTKALQTLLPSTMRFLPLKRREKYNKDRPYAQPLFDDSIFGDRFVPLLVTPEELRIGYHLKNSFVVSTDQPKDSSLSDDESLFEWLRPFLLYRRKPVDRNLADYRAAAEKDPRGFLVLPINKKKALAYLSDPQCSGAPEASALRGLHYSVKRATIEGTLFEPNGKLKKKFEGLSPEAVAVALQGSQKKEETNAIKCSFSHQRRKFFDGTIEYPGHQEWLRLLQIPIMAKAIKRGNFTRQFLESDAGRSALAAFFKDAGRRPGRHQRRRSQYGLTLLASPSGGLLVRRKAFDGASVYQLMQTNGSAYGSMGLDPQEGLQNKVVQYQEIYRSPGLAPIEERKEPNMNVRMDEYRCLELPKANEYGIRSVQMAPGSLPRPYLCVEFERKAGEALLGVKGNAIYSLKAKCKLPSEAVKKYLKAAELPAPRDNNVVVTGISTDTIALQYTGDGHLKDLRKLYAKGRPV